MRKVVLGDGQKCSNPMCGRTLGLDAHHLQFRSLGSRTAFFNETALCPACHSAAHLGLLRIEGDPLTGLKWIPRSAELDLDLGEDVAALLSTAEVRVVEAAAPSAPAATQSAATAPAPTAAPQERRFGGGESTAVEKKSTAVDYRTVQQKINAPLLRLLVDLGYKKMDAVRRLDIAWKRFEGRPNLPSESELVYEAFRA